MNHSEMRKFYNLSFLSFWLIFYPLDPDPWIRIFLRIRIQEAKILRILSTAFSHLHMNSSAVTRLSQA